MSRASEFTPDQQTKLQETVVEAVRSLGKPKVAAHLGANQTTVDRYLKGTMGMSHARAERLAELVGKTLASIVGPRLDNPGSAELASRVSSGVDVAMAILREQAATRTFTNLGFFLEFNDRRRDGKKKHWSTATIVAAAAGVAGDEDLSPDDWEQVLDRIEEFHTILMKDFARGFAASRSL